MRRELVFQTQKKEQAKKTRKFALAILLFFLILAGIVALWFIKYIDHDITNLFHKEEDTSEGTPAAERRYGDFSYLLFCGADADGKNAKSLRFIVVAKVDMGNKTVSVSALSDREVVEVGGVTASLADHFRSGGLNRLRAAVETMREIKFNAYVYTTDDGFDDAINALGTVTLEVPEQISYRSNEFNFICAQGKKIFRGADLLKYLRYCHVTEPDGLQTQAEIFAELFRQYLTPNRVARADYYYAKVIDHVESDITVMVFSDYKAAMEYLTADDGFTVWTAD